MRQIAIVLSLAACTPDSSCDLTATWSVSTPIQGTVIVTPWGATIVPTREGTHGRVTAISETGQVTSTETDLQDSAVQPHQAAASSSTLLVEFPDPGTLVAYDTALRTRWSMPLEAHMFAANARDEVIVGLFANEPAPGYELPVLKIDPDGTVRWTVKMNDTFVRAMAFAENGDVFVFAASEFPAGEHRWRLSANDGHVLEDAVLPLSLVPLAISGDGSFVGETYNPRDAVVRVDSAGNALWRYPIGFEDGVATPPGGSIYVKTDATIISLDPATGMVSAEAMGCAGHMLGATDSEYITFPASNRLAAYALP